MCQTSIRQRNAIFMDLEEPFSTSPYVQTLAFCFLLKLCPTSSRVLLMFSHNRINMQEKLVTKCIVNNRYQKSGSRLF